MAYLDWDKSENDRVESYVAAEIEGNPSSLTEEVWARSGEQLRGILRNRRTGRLGKGTLLFEATVFTM